MANSAIAVIDSEGLTPGFAEIMEPSMTIMRSLSHPTTNDDVVVFGVLRRGRDHRVNALLQISR